MSYTPCPEFESLPEDVRARLARAHAELLSLGRVLVAFSGGVDSTLLLALAVRALGSRNVLAVTSTSPLVPRREVEEARRLADRLDAELVTIETRELDDPQFIANPPDHCYHCKRSLLQQLRALADHRGYTAVVLGNNADDTGDFRPGMAAARELGARSPLLEAGLTKQDVRQASRAMGLPTWDKPSYACLASRIPYGTPIDRRTLRRIERAEYVLRDLGFRQCRVRHHGDVARIEVPPEQIEQVLADRERISRELRELGYAYVTVDLQGFRSGSLNEPLSGAERQAAQ